MNLPKTLTLASFVCLASFASSSGQTVETLLNDDFSSLNRDTQNLPSESAWYLRSSSGSSANLSASSGSLVFNAGNIANLVTYFTGSGTPASLEVGEIMSLSFDFTPDGLVAGTELMRFGLFNSGGSRVTADFFSDFGSSLFSDYDGYSVWFTPTGGSESPYRIYERTGTSNFIFAGGANTVRGEILDQSFGIANNGTYAITLDLERSANGMTITSSVNGRILSATDSSDLTTYFDTLAFQYSSDYSGTMAIDNVNISIIPEPGTTGLLMGAMALVWIGLRRRVRKAA